MKRLILLILELVMLALILIAAFGCESIKLDGFSAGVAILSTNVETTTTNDLGAFGTLTSRKNMKINEVMPIFLLNFKFD